MTRNSYKAESFGPSLKSKFLSRAPYTEKFSYMNRVLYLLFAGGVWHQEAVLNFELQTSTVAQRLSVQ